MALGDSPPCVPPPGRGLPGSPQRVKQQARGSCQHGSDQTLLGSCWGHSGGDEDLVGPQCSPPPPLPCPASSHIPPEPVWQGPVPLPRQRHLGWVFPGHALLHSGAESTRRRKEDLLKPDAPPRATASVPMRLPAPRHQCRCPPGFSPASPPCHRGGSHRKPGRGRKEAEASEK